jgi:phosphomannomutase
MIRFGTSGWRALIGDEFTFLNVRRVASALSSHIKENAEYGVMSPDYRAFAGNSSALRLPLVVLGFDGRFLSEEFAHEVAGVFAAEGIRSVMSNSDVPTPVVGHTVLDRKAIGGVVITASHNSSHYNGFKWMPFWAGAAPPDVTSDIERRLEIIQNHEVRMMTLERSARESWVETTDFKPSYFKHLLSLLDVNAIKKAHLKVGIDTMHGAARNYLRPVLESCGVEVSSLHENRDVLYEGHSPEPAPENLQELATLMKKNHLQLGFACDGDADRFGVLDSGGVWISANEILALVLEHLVSNRGLTGKIARSVMTSHFVDAVAKAHNLDIRETPVGFKFIGELLRTGQYLLGGEESGGLSIRNHVPDKDGILACLLVAEMAAIERKPISVLRDRLFKKVGAFHNTRINFHMPHLRERLELEDRLHAKPPLDLAGGSVWRIDESDGFKFILRDGSWLGLRPSGTESAFRIYAEASTSKKLAALVDAGKDLLRKKA